jgi:predicted nucleic acid-binding protein
VNASASGDSFLHRAILRIEAGLETSYTTVAGLVDTNILVYRYDSRFPQKQSLARDLLRRGIADKSLILPHQVLVEFIAVVTRPIDRGPALLTADEAYSEVEDMLAQFPVIYPSENTLRTALRGAERYKLSWFDAHLWAYADERGLDTLWSEDFQDGRLYGRVKAQNPFRSPSVHEPAPPPYGR